MHSFTFDGLNSREYCGLYVSGGGTYNAPKRDIEKVTIPGRNGELTIDHGRFENIQVSYDGWIMDDPEVNIVKARNWLCSRIGYKKLTDDYHPTEYRMARFIDGIEFTVAQTTPLVGAAKVVFDCMPQRFLISGDNPIEVNESNTFISSPTFFESLPLVKVDGSGSGKVIFLAFNSDDSVRFRREVSISDIGDSIYLDSEIERAYYIIDGVITAADNKITLSGGYPKMNCDTISDSDDPPVTNRSTCIRFSGGVTKVTITPRWWRI